MDGFFALKVKKLKAASHKKKQLLELGWIGNKGLSGLIIKLSWIGRTF